MVRDGASSELNSIVSMKIYTFLETPPWTKTRPKMCLLAESYSATRCLSMLPWWTRKPKLELESYGKMFIYSLYFLSLPNIFCLELALHHLKRYSASGVDFDASAWVEETGINILWSFVNQRFLSAHGYTWQHCWKISTKKVTWEVRGALWKRWPSMKGFQNGECLRWSGVVKEEHPTMNLKLEEQGYRGLISNMHCFSKVLILKLLILQIPCTQMIWSRKQLLPPIDFEKFTVRDHCVSLTCLSIPNKKGKLHISDTKRSWTWDK